MMAWIKLSRRLLGDVVWRMTDGQRVVFVTMLLSADWQPQLWRCVKCNDTHELPAGSFCESLTTLATLARVNRSTANRAIQRLIQQNVIFAKSRNRCHAVYVFRNWAKYQEVETATETPPKHRRNSTRTPNREEKEEGKKKERTVPAGGDTKARTATPASEAATALASKWMDRLDTNDQSSADRRKRLPAWATTLDKCHGRGHSWPDLAALIDWIAADDFWSDNCQSALKLLRKDKDKELYLDVLMKRSTKKPKLRSKGLITDPNDPAWDEV